MASALFSFRRKSATVKTLFHAPAPPSYGPKRELCLPEHNGILPDCIFHVKRGALLYNR
jgi:hypothetical protein